VNVDAGRQPVAAPDGSGDAGDEVAALELARRAAASDVGVAATSATDLGLHDATPYRTAT